MTARFAGSRSVDERRRRRLAGEDESVAFEEPGAALDDSGDRETPLVEEPPPSVLGETWMPARAWKAWLLVLGVLLVAAGAVVGGWFVDRDAEFHGPATVELLGLQSGRLVRGLGTVFLFLAGQLSLVVWWRRSRSTRDFNGRYDVWAWTAAAWFAFAIAHGLQAHLAWTETVALLWEPDFWNKTILSWFAPAVGVGGVIWMAARADARRCRSGWWFLTFAGLCWVAAGCMELGVGSVELGPWRELATVSTTLAGHVLGFAGMYLHARFVTHVCCDPPVTKRRTKAERKVADPTNDVDVDAQDVAVPPPAEEKPKPTRRRSTSRRTATKSTAKPEPKPVEPKAAPEPPAELRPEPPQPEADDEPDAPETVPMRSHESAEADDEGGFDDGPPAEMLHGLSKRQKKKLRKEWRDRQRAARDAA